MLGPPDEHDELVIDPRPQRLGQAHDARRPVLVQHVEVERDARFQIGQAEQPIHHHAHVHGTAARLQHQPDRLVRFVADIGQDRQLLVVDQVRDLLDQLALLHPVGDFGHDRGPAAALLALDRPARAHPKTPAAGDIAFADYRGRIDHQPAGREVGALHEAQDRIVARVAVVDQ